MIHIDLLAEKPRKGDTLTRLHNKEMAYFKLSLYHADKIIALSDQVIESQRRMIDYLESKLSSFTKI